MTPEPRSGRSALLLGGLVAAAAFVFAVLPRWMSPAVVTHVASSPTPLSAESRAPSGGLEAIPSHSPDVAVAAPPRAAGTSHAGAAPAPSDPAASASPQPASETELATLLSAGLAALDRDEFAQARESFARAKDLEAGSAAAADGLTRAEAGLLELTLVAHRQRAEAAEAREDWRGALREYDAAQKLDPAVAFAVQGRGRANLRAALDERLQGYLDRPERLAAAAVTREAQRALEQAGEAEPAGPRLRAQREALERLLAGARMPIPVRIVSDGLTTITIQRVGPLGAFKEKVVELLPGSYVVVGARAGYRDTRRTLVVPVGKATELLDVRCHEAI